MSRLGKKIPIRTCVFTFSLKLQKWSFHFADLPRTGKKCIEIIIIIKACEGRAKVLFLFIKYAKFFMLLLPSHCRSLLTDTHTSISIHKVGKLILLETIAMTGSLHPCSSIETNLVEFHCCLLWVQSLGYCHLPDKSRFYI